MSLEMNSNIHGFYVPMHMHVFNARSFVPNNTSLVLKSVVIKLRGDKDFLLHFYCLLVSVRNGVRVQYNLLPKVI